MPIYGNLVGGQSASPIIDIDLNGSNISEDYLRPQSPLQHKSGDYFYPLTTADQVIMEDGSRLDYKLNEEFLHKSGGIMAGNIAMNGNMITGLAEPLALNDATTKAYVDNKRKIFNITLMANAWVGTSAPYAQTINVDGIVESDTPHYGLIYSENIETALLEKENWALVDDLDTANGSVTLTCFESKPSIDIVVQLEVYR